MRAWLTRLTMIGSLVLASIPGVAGPLSIPAADRPLLRESEAFYRTEWEDAGGDTSVLNSAKRRVSAVPSGHWRVCRAVH